LFLQSNGLFAEGKTIITHCEYEKKYGGSYLIKYKLNGQPFSFNVFQNIENKSTIASGSLVILNLKSQKMELYKEVGSKEHSFHKKNIENWLQKFYRNSDKNYSVKRRRFQRKSEIELKLEGDVKKALDLMETKMRYAEYPRRRHRKSE
jgi:hypothetical protein